GEPDAEVDEALASLGYVSARGAPEADNGDRPDPKDRIALEDILGVAGGLLEAGNLAGAERALWKAGELDPRNKEAALLRARVQAAQGRLDAARAILAECLAWPPASANALVHETAGAIELDAGEAAAAEAHFATAVALETLNVNARYHHGLAAYRLGRYADAAARWREVLRLDPGHALAREWLPDAERRAEEETGR
ncbi:tetratricopeptide repeat protein, partial [bacterium]|nr:tetratricopeptide repeat protein [bacterium]